MTRLALASQAIGSKNKSAALSNLLDANVLVGELEKNRPEIVSNYQLTFGKAKYFEGTVEKDYYLPVADDLEIQQLYASSQHRGNPEVQLRSSDVIETTLQLDLKSVHSAVESAQMKLNAGDFPGADRALAGVFTHSLTSQVAVKDPLSRVWVNLNLAQDFMAQGDNQSARFSLEAARVDLRKLESAKMLSRSSADARALNREIGRTEQSLKNPSLAAATLQSIQASMGRWSEKIKNWV